MYRNAVFVRTIRRLAVTLLCASAAGLPAGEVNLTRTNWVERWITNLIEVQMPANRFVNEYHTNWITQMRTNVIDIYATNLVTRTATNRVMVDAFRTNFITEWHTNWQALNVTNWETVAVIRTNWPSQPVAAVIGVGGASASTVSTATPKDNPPAVREPATSASLAADGLVIEASRGARAAANGQIDITLKIRAATGAAAPQVQQWRIEREDGAILCFGQDQDFRRDLPVGRYKLEVKILRETENPAASTRAILSVTPREVALEQRLTARR